MSTSILRNRVQILKQNFTQSWGLAFHLLSEAMIAEAPKRKRLNTVAGCLTHLLLYGHSYLKFWTLIKLAITQ